MYTGLVRVVVGKGETVSILWDEASRLFGGDFGHGAQMSQERFGVEDVARLSSTAGMGEGATDSR